MGGRGGGEQTDSTLGMFPTSELKYSILVVLQKAIKSNWAEF